MKEQWRCNGPYKTNEVLFFEDSAMGLELIQWDPNAGIKGIKRRQS